MVNVIGLQAREGCLASLLLVYSHSMVLGGFELTS
jgi:hypothetical protein